MDSVLTGSCFSDDPLFTHALCQQSLSQGIINLMGAGVGQVLPFQEYPGSPRFFCKPLREVKGSGAADIVAAEAIEFFLKGSIPLYFSV